MQYVPTAFKRLKSLIKKAISMQNIFPSRPDCSFLQYDDVYKYFILCKMFNVICDGKHLHFVNIRKTDLDGEKND